MTYHENTPYGGRRSSDIPVAIITSSLTAAAVTVAVLFVTGNLKTRDKAGSDDSAENEGAVKESTRQVPPIVGLTPDVAQELLRARDLRLVVQGRKPDNSVKEGQIAEQDPLAQSELPKNGSVSVVVSAGMQQVEVPNVVGKSRQEAEQALSAAHLTVKEVLETGTCAPGTVCETKPSVGTSVDDKAPVSLVVAPTATVPDVVNKYMGKAKEEIEKAGFKVGKIRWRANDYKEPNVVLSQEPAAGTVVAPGSEIDLFVNEE